MLSQKHNSVLSLTTQDVCLVYEEQPVKLMQFDPFEVQIGFAPIHYK